MASLRNVLLLTRNVGEAARFYTKGLGLRLLASTEDVYAELDAGSGVRLVVRQTERF